MENVGDIPDEDVQRSHGGLPFRPVVAQGNEDNGDDTGGDVGFGLLGLFGVGNDDHNDENVSQGNGSRDNLLNLPRMEDEIVETIGEQLSNGKLEPGKIGHQVELWLASLYENLDDLSDGIQTANDMLFRMRKQGSAVNPEALGQAMGCVRRLMEVPEAIEVFAAKQVKLSELDTFLKKYQCESLDEMITLVNRAVDRNKDRVKQLETEKETLKAALKDAEAECARAKAEIAKSDAKVPAEIWDEKPAHCAVGWVLETGGDADRDEQQLEEHCFGRERSLSTDMSVPISAAQAHLLERIGNLYSNMDHSDVMFICKGIDIPAHKNILAQLSPVFKSMFAKSTDTKPCFIDVGKTSVDAFNQLLKFIYSGEIDLNVLGIDVIFEVFRLAVQYEVKYLDCIVISYLKDVCSIDNVCDILSEVGLMREELSTNCLHFIDTHAEEVFQHDGFNRLSVEAVERVVEYSARSTLPDVTFTAILGWFNDNPDKKASFPKILQHIDVNVLPMTQTARLVRPVEFLDPVAFTDLLLAQSNTTDAAIQCLDPIIVRPPDDDAWIHTIGSGRDITIDLNGAFRINLIEMDLAFRLKCSYIVSTSVDGTRWTRLIDHAKYICRDHQTLYFEDRDVRYICIRGMAPTSANFSISSFSACFTTRLFRIDPRSTLFIPHQNVSTIAKHAITVEGSNGNAFIFGTFAEYDGGSGFTCHTIGTGCIMLQLPQPYLLDQMKLLLWDKDQRQYSYHIEVSTDKKQWTRIVEENLVSSWREVNFNRQPVVFVKIVGTHNTANTDFHVVHIACQAQ
uniref:BTB domain-containing protein n=1 Tax=Panagrellus redivivus TaxID=6233 RepID=A0A7E4V492_PANRE